MKECKICQIILPLSDFEMKGKYYRGSCKSCIRKKKRDFRLLHIDEFRARERMKEANRALRAKADRPKKTHGNYKVDIDTLRQLAAEALSYTELLCLIGYAYNGSGVRRRLKEMITLNNIDISHFTKPKVTKWEKSELEPVALESYSISDLLNRLNLRVSGASVANMRKVLEKLEISTFHFSRKLQDMQNSKRQRAVGDVARAELLSGLVKKPVNSQMLRSLMTFEQRPYVCTKCGLGDEWDNEPITLEVDHVDGDRTNQSSSNLRYLCPNCHSQTETYGRKNRKNDNGDATPTIH